MTKYDRIISAMITSLGGGSVEEQLKAVYVEQIDTEDFSGHNQAGVGRLRPPWPFCTPTDPCFRFRITLNRSECNDFELWALVLGHEVAHIFEWSKIWQEAKNLEWEDVEKLCDEFAHEWLRTGQNKNEVLSLLERLRTDGVIKIF